MISGSRNSQPNSLRSSLESKQVDNQKSRRPSFVENLIFQYKVQSNKKQVNNKLVKNPQPLLKGKQNKKSFQSKFHSNQGFTQSKYFNSSLKKSQTLKRSTEQEVHLPLKQVNFLQKFKSAQIKPDYLYDISSNNKILQKASDIKRVKGSKNLNYDFETQYESEILKNALNSKSNLHNCSRERFNKKNSCVNYESKEMNVERSSKYKAQQNSTSQQLGKTLGSQFMEMRFEKDFSECAKYLLCEKTQEGLNLMLRMKKQLRDAKQLCSLKGKNNQYEQRKRMKVNEYWCLFMYELFVNSRECSQQMKIKDKEQMRKLKIKLGCKYRELTEYNESESIESEKCRDTDIPQMLLERSSVVTKLNSLNSWLSRLIDRMGVQYNQCSSEESLCELQEAKILIRQLDQQLISMPQRQQHQRSNPVDEFFLLIKELIQIVGQLLLNPIFPFNKKLPNSKQEESSQNQSKRLCGFLFEMVNKIIKLTLAAYIYIKSQQNKLQSKNNTAIQQDRHSHSQNNLYVFSLQSLQISFLVNMLSFIFTVITKTLILKGIYKKSIVLIEQLGLVNYQNSLKKIFTQQINYKNKHQTKDRCSQSQNINNKYHSNIQLEGIKGKIKNKCLSISKACLMIDSILFIICKRQEDQQLSTLDKQKQSKEQQKIKVKEQLLLNITQSIKELTQFFNKGFYPATNQIENLLQNQQCNNKILQNNKKFTYLNQMQKNKNNLYKSINQLQQFQGLLLVGIVFPQLIACWLDLIQQLFYVQLTQYQDKQNGFIGESSNICAYHFNLLKIMQSLRSVLIQLLSDFQNDDYNEAHQQIQSAISKSFKIYHNQERRTEYLNTARRCIDKIKQLLHGYCTNTNIKNIINQVESFRQFIDMRLTFMYYRMGEYSTSYNLFSGGQINQILDHDHNQLQDYQDSIYSQSLSSYTNIYHSNNLKNKHGRFIFGLLSKVERLVMSQTKHLIPDQQKVTAENPSHLAESFWHLFNRELMCSVEGLHYGYVLWKMLLSIQWSESWKSQSINESNQMSGEYLQQLGEVCLYQVVERLKDIVRQWGFQNNGNESRNINQIKQSSSISVLSLSADFINTGKTIQQIYNEVFSDFDYSTDTQNTITDNQLQKGQIASLMKQTESMNDIQNIQSDKKQLQIYTISIKAQLLAVYFQMEVIKSKLFSSHYQNTQPFSNNKGMHSQNGLSKTINRKQLQAEHLSITKKQKLSDSQHQLQYYQQALNNYDLLQRLQNLKKNASNNKPVQFHMKSVKSTFQQIDRTMNHMKQRFKDKLTFNLLRHLAQISLYLREEYQVLIANNNDK